MYVRTYVHKGGKATVKHTLTYVHTHPYIHNEARPNVLSISVSNHSSLHVSCLLFFPFCALPTICPSAHECHLYLLSLPLLSNSYLCAATESH